MGVRKCLGYVFEQRKYFRRGLITESSSTTTFEPSGGIQYTVSQLMTDTNVGLKSVHSDGVVQGIVSLLTNLGSQERVVVLVPNQKSIVDNWSGSVYVAEFKNTRRKLRRLHYRSRWRHVRPAVATAAMFARSRTDSPPGHLLNQTFAGDPVNVANGNMFRDEVDFTFANPIIPLDFARHYDSQNKLDVGFGVGWVHGFTGFVYEEQDPANATDKDYVWLRGNGERHTFENLDFTLPNTLFGDVESRYATTTALDQVSRPSGTQYSFEPISSGISLISVTGKKIYSRLVAIKDATGNQGVTITYDDTPTVKSIRVKEVRVDQYAEPLSAVHLQRQQHGQRQSFRRQVSFVTLGLRAGDGYAGLYRIQRQTTHASQACRPGSTTITNYEYFNDGTSFSQGSHQEDHRAERRVASSTNTTPTAACFA